MGMIFEYYQEITDVTSSRLDYRVRNYLVMLELYTRLSS